MFLKNHQFRVFIDGPQVMNRRYQHRLVGGVAVDQSLKANDSEIFETPTKKVRQLFEQFGVIANVRREVGHNCSTVFVGRVKNDRQQGRKNV